MRIKRILFRYDIKSEVLTSLFIALLLQSCTRMKINLDDRLTPPVWLTPAGNLQKQNFSPDALKPPLVLKTTLRFNSAPGQNLLAADSTIFIGTKGGRIYAYDLNRGKYSGKLKLPENSEAEFSIHEDRLLLIGLKYGRETLLCYDLLKGTYLWKRRAGLLAKAPVVADSSVYVVARFKHADRYNLRTGKRIWRYAFSSQAHSSPAISDGLLIFATDDGSILALDRKTGVKVWQNEARAAVFASPVIYENTVFAAGLDSTVYALRLQDGKRIWTYTTHGRIRNTPAIANDILIVSNSGGQLVALRAQTGEMLWEYRTDTAFSTSPLISGTFVYVGDLKKRLRAFDLSSGRLVWQTELRGRIRTNPIQNQDLLVIGSEDRYVYIFQAGTSEATSE